MTPEQAREMVYLVYDCIEQNRYGFDQTFNEHASTLYGVPEHLDLKQGMALLQLLGAEHER